MTFDYRSARDHIFGIVRYEGSDKIKEVIRTSTSASERMLLLALVEFAPNIEPAIATIAKMMGMDARSVTRLVNSCREKGLLAVELRPGLGRDATNRYSLLYPRHTVTPDTVSPLTKTAVTPDKNDTYPRHTVTQSRQEADNEADKIPEPDRLEGTAPVSSVSSKSKKAKSSKPKKAKFEPAPGAHKQVADFYFAEFERSRGCKPVFGGAEGRAVGGLLEKLDGRGGADEACKRVRNAFASFRGASVTILAIAKDPDAFAKLEVPRGTVAAQRGPNDADVIARARAQGTA